MAQNNWGRPFRVDGGGIDIDYVFINDIRSTGTTVSTVDAGSKIDLGIKVDTDSSAGVFRFKVSGGVHRLELSGDAEGILIADGSALSFLALPSTPSILGYSEAKGYLWIGAPDGRMLLTGGFGWASVVEVEEEECNETDVY